VELVGTGNLDTGGAWDLDGNVITALSPSSALSLIPAAGGAPRPLTKLMQGDATHRWPQVLPGGKAILFTSSPSITGMESANIEAADAKTGQAKVILRGGYFGRYVAGGFLVYVHEGVIFAARFDAARLQLLGSPVPLVEDVASDPIIGDGHFAFGDGPGGAGTLAYLAGKASVQVWSVNLLDGSGQSRPLIAAPGAYYNPMFSPDGRRLAFAMGAQGTDIFVYDLARGAMTRLTSNNVSDRPVWTPDGARIAFAAKDGMWWMRSDGSAEAELLVRSDSPIVPWSFTSDGRRLAYFEVLPDTGYDLGILPLDLTDPGHPKPGTRQSFLRTPYSEALPAFSPDNRWIAYSSNESGTNEIYVRPASGAARKWQISAGGGMFPSWSPNSGDLYFESPDTHIQAVGYVVKGDSFEAGKPRVWSDRRLQSIFKSNLALAPDGKHFAVFEASEAKVAPHLGFLLNFGDELRRKLP
jgi:serine/threonine-protein kinase